MVRGLKLAIPVLAITLGLVFCNIFMPTGAQRDPERYGPHALVVEGKIKMREGKWEEASELFRKAIDDNDSLSEAYFYLGKCILRIHDIRLDQVWGEVNPDREGEDSLSVPFLYSPPESISYNDPIVPFTLPGSTDTAYKKIDSVFLERKRVYDAVCQALKLLEEITYNPDRMDGVVKRKQYESDYLIEISVKAVLSIVDINNNDTLDFSGKEREAFRILCQDIPSLDPDSMNFDSLRSISNDPKDINANLDMIIASVNKADTSYNLFHNELLEGYEKSDVIDTNTGSGIGEIIKNFGGILPYFYYNDFKDNDGDYYDTDGNGKRDRMIWIDWSKNNNIGKNDKIDIYDTIDGVTGVYQIGSTAHREARPEYYDTLDADTGADAKYSRYRYMGPHSYEFIFGDWGIDEEILDGIDNDNDGLTDEDTRIAADTLDDDGDHHNTDTSPAANGSIYNPMEWNDDNGNLKIDISGSPIAGATIDSLFFATHGSRYDSSVVTSTYILPRYGVTGGEWYAGDYGVDEEWFDGLDNDGDGLIDEDVGERLPPESLRQAIIDRLTAQQQ